MNNSKWAIQKVFNDKSTTLWTFNHKKKFPVDWKKRIFLIAINNSIQYRCFFFICLDFSSLTGQLCLVAHNFDLIKILSSNSSKRNFNVTSVQENFQLNLISKVDMHLELNPLSSQILINSLYGTRENWCFFSFLSFRF